VFREVECARDIALKRRAKQAAVLAAVLRGAFIPHTSAGAAHVEVLVQHDGLLVRLSGLIPMRASKVSY
jgi:hypothetical protein